MLVGAGPRSAGAEVRRLGGRRDRRARAGCGGWPVCAGMPGRRARICWTASARVFIKGADDIEGVADPGPGAEAAWPAIAWAMFPPRRVAAPWSMTFAAPPPGSRSTLDRVDACEVSLDLYRSEPRPRGQPVLPSPAVPQVPFAQWVSGPDYVAGDAA